MNQNKDTIFKQGFDAIMRNVDQAVKSVSNELDDSLEVLAQKVGYLLTWIGFSGVHSNS